MKLKSSSILIIFIFVAMLASCVSQRNKRCPDFGGGTWQIEQKHESINENKIQLDQFESGTPNVIKVQNEHEIIDVLNNSKVESLLLSYNKSPKLKDESKQVNFEKSSIKKEAKNSIKKKVGRSIGWLSVISGLVGMLSISFIAFSVLAILIGLLGIKLKISNWGTILSYAGISLGVLGILSPILNTIVGVLILVVLILVLMKLYHLI